ncbi:uncharacterized protein LOC128555651 [Mercenaria mercenaria]|uniref:uncharacterized protein LOC128555651 n=1 Tax=Mercenaria mercenaria TaxID=6596 RepID=UPI00234EFB7B|nr:uncharacterized protein LOC128555651 [Mercenaria mercenaria]XP_053394639.1 uncharacterized protein LOC128555651 [Mercenaria mercenaria]XP_053394640.1 uncharacterized protein LOC128555651 [Mercenaria mercenaria]
MSVIVQNDDGCIIDHLKASKIIVKTDDGSVQQYRLKSDLFEILEPYRMDSQFEKLQSTELKDDGQKRKRKRKRQEPLNIGEKMAADFHNEVKDSIEKAYERLLELGKEMAYFMNQNCSNIKNNNSAARQAAQCDGSLHSFIDMCEESQDWNQECQVGKHAGSLQSCTENGVKIQQAWNQRCQTGHHAGSLQSYDENDVKTQKDWNQRCQEGQCDGLLQCCTKHDEQSCRDWNQCLPVYQVTKEKDLSLRGIVNVIWQNTEQFALTTQCRGDNYIIPPNSTFLMSDITQLNRTGKALGKFDLVVMDPPWTNKSVKRKKKYYTMDNDMLLDIPLVDMMNPGCLVVVWVTNKQKHMQFVTDQLFQSNNIKFVARWYWLKVTKTGQCVFDLDSAHKKPYETLIIGKFHPAAMETMYSCGGCDCNCHQNKAQGHEEISTDKPVYSSETVTSVNASNEPSNANLSINETDRQSRSDSNHGNRGHIPKNKVIISVPCSLHSKKPPLTEVLKSYLPDKPRCLELFARNLLPDWTSWGNEVLLHQHQNFYEEVT